MTLPNDIVSFLKEKQANGNSPCSICNSNCCYGPGFAILDNVQMNYQRYCAGSLKASDHDFDQGLSMTQFVYRYYNRTIMNGSLMLFFPKVYTDKDDLSTVPPWDFWKARDYVERRTGSKGCVFLDRIKMKSDLTSNHCILHTPQCSTDLTEKPIDCIFLHCNGLRNVVIPTKEQSAMWFTLLDYRYPNSVDRFKQLCPDSID